MALSTHMLFSLLPAHINDADNTEHIVLYSLPAPTQVLPEPKPKVVWLLSQHSYIATTMIAAKCYTQNFLELTDFWH